MFRKFVRKRIEAQPDQPDRASLDDYERFHTLCTVWPMGCMTQAYLKTPTRGLAHLAAAEVRKAVEQSFYAAYEIGQDQIALLRRVETGPLHTDQHLYEVAQED